MLSTTEMIFGMVGLLVLLLGSIGVFGLRMLMRMRRPSTSPPPSAGDSVRSDR